MGLFNLTFAQFATLFASVAGVVVALYLFDRSRRRQVVASLRFWRPAEKPAPVSRRRRIQQPWSLLLQLLSLLLLLLAIAQPRLGNEDSQPRDHVVVLDTSAWMAARNAGARPQYPTLMDEARARAFAYVRALPANDRIMIVRADALATPAGGFESDRNKLRQAIAQSRPGSTALNLDQALEFARHSLAMGARRAGEIAFAGSGRINEASQVSAEGLPKNLRVLPVADAVENIGFRKLGLRRSAADPGVWEIFVSARNYGVRPHAATVALSFGGAPAGLHRVDLAPGADRETAFTYRTRANGLLEARLLPDDGFPMDNRAAIELPEQRTIEVAVYTNEPELLRPVLQSTPRVHAVFRRTADYRAAEDVNLTILDRFRPPAPPKGDAVWIDPPAQGSPIAIRSTASAARLSRWNTDHQLGAGLRTRDARLDSSSVFEAAPSDVRVAEVDAGPVIVARDGKTKTVVMGFHPMRSALRYELAAPLLFANVLHWVSPGLFLRWEVTGGSVGAVQAPLPAGRKPDQVRVLLDDGSALPFTVRNQTLSFFSGAPGSVRVLTGDRESVYSLTLPELGQARWEIPAAVRRGIPGRDQALPSARDLWPWLALAGAAGLLAEWLIYGRMGRRLARFRSPGELLTLFKFRKAS